MSRNETLEQEKARLAETPEERAARLAEYEAEARQKPIPETPENREARLAEEDRSKPLRTPLADRDRARAASLKEYESRKNPEKVGGAEIGGFNEAGPETPAETQARLLEASREEELKIFATSLHDAENTIHILEKEKAVLLTHAESAMQEAQKWEGLHTSEASARIELEIRLEVERKMFKLQTDALQGTIAMVSKEFHELRIAFEALP